LIIFRLSMHNNLVLKNRKLIIVLTILIILAGGGPLIWKYFRSSFETTKPERKLPREEKEINYADILKQMFPGKELVQTENREDCFFDKKSQFDSHFNIYCIEKAVEGYFTGKDKETLLLVVRFGTEFVDADYSVNRLREKTMPINAHAMGMYHAFLALFDLKGQKLLTEPFVFNDINDKLFWSERNDHLIADSGEVIFYDCKDSTYILFNGKVAGQGWFSSFLKLLRVKNGKFEQVWPNGEWPGAYKEVIAQEDRLSVYELQEYLPHFTPEEVTPTEGEPKHLFDLYWKKDTCSFEKK